MAMSLAMLRSWDWEVVSVHLATQMVLEHEEEWEEGGCCKIICVDFGFDVSLMGGWCCWFVVVHCCWVVGCSLVGWCCWLVGIGDWLALVIGWYRWLVGIGDWLALVIGWYRWLVGVNG